MLYSIRQQLCNTHRCRQHATMQHLRLQPAAHWQQQQQQQQQPKRHCLALAAAQAHQTSPSSLAPHCMYGTNTTNTMSSNSSTSIIWSRSSGTRVRCAVTPGPARPSHISWLAMAEVLQPSPSNNGSNGGSSSSSSHDTVSPSEFAAVDEDELLRSEFDAIMVLAGGLTPDGGLPDYVHRRLDMARDLHLLQHRRPAVVCLGGGTPHKPSIIGPTGHVVHESTSCAAYLMASGVQPECIYKDTASFDTVGNTYFSLTVHSLPAGWRKIAVVTSDFHMPRSRALFADMYRTAGRAVFKDPNWFQLSFVSASDNGVFEDAVYDARLLKEAASLAHWQSVAPSLADLQSLHAWLFSDHLCYAVQRQHEFGKRTIQDPKLLESY